MSQRSIQQIWSQLETEETKLEEEQKRIKEIWAKITECHQKNEERLAKIMSEDSLKFVPNDTQVVLNVGGQLFTTTAAVLCRDRFSVLAALCTEEPPLSPDEDGVFFLERDWWLFRHIMQFLRSGVLPEEVALLKELFVEASFYRLNTLRKAIQQRFATSCSPSDSVPRVKIPLQQDIYPVPSQGRRRDSLHRIQNIHTSSSQARRNDGFFDPLPDPYKFVS